MHLCLFEDTLAKNFLPLTALRPVYDLRCGMLSMRQRIVGCLRPSALTLLTRNYLEPLVSEQNPGVKVNALGADSFLLINGRCIMSPEAAKTLKKGGDDCVFIAAGEVAAARLGAGTRSRLALASTENGMDVSLLMSLPHVELDVSMVRYPWDLVHVDESVYENDFRLLTRRGVNRKGDIHPSAVLLGKKNIHIGEKSRVDPGVVIMAEQGGVFIDGGVRVWPNVVIEGPCHIGEGTVIKSGARIYGHTSIGPVCKVGGEVEHSILHARANKQHDGFLGHSYLGEWVNLGAGTSTSNLKNTYGNIRMNIGGAMVDTGKMFLGLVSGDHVKTGINMSIDTGTFIGTASALYGSKLPPKTVPSFTWGDGDNLTEYPYDKAVSVASKVMARRGIQMSAAYSEAFRSVFTATEHERTNIRK